MHRPPLPPNLPGAYLYRDKDSFDKPLFEAPESCIAAFYAASSHVKGAEARVRQAIDDLKSLEDFNAALEWRMRTRTFHDLPRLKRGGGKLRGFHQLTVGSWRGVFLVGRDRDNVIALVFSKHPHRLEQRLGEISARYLPHNPVDANGRHV
jgi:hypothetical protein